MGKSWRSKHLYLYLLTSLIKFHLFFTSLFIFFVLISNIWYFAPEWLELGISVKHILIMVSFFIPGALLQSTAIALSLAFIVSYGKLQFNLEIDAMRMLGFSSYQIFKPALHYSFVLLVVLFVNSFILYPLSIGNFEEYYAKVLTQHVSVRSQSMEPQLLGETLLYVEADEDKEYWVLVEKRKGYKLIVWANGTELSWLDDTRILTAQDVKILAVESNAIGQNWHWISAVNFKYPLLFNINTQSYNPYDRLTLDSFIQETGSLWQEHDAKKEPYKKRIAELNALLKASSLPESDRQLYERELAAIKKDLKFSSNFISLIFVALLRISHILLIVALLILVYLTLEYFYMQRWGITVAVWLVAIVVYWILFYFISYKLLNLTWNAFSLIIPIVMIFFIDFILFYLIIRRRRRWYAKN